MHGGIFFDLKMCFNEFHLSYLHGGIIRMSHPVRKNLFKYYFSFILRNILCLIIEINRFLLFFF